MEKQLRWRRIRWHRKRTQNSGLIADLQSRQSVLPAGGVYAKVADAVVSAGSGAAAAELRVAQLKAEARSKNWLPSIGPSVNLTSLGGLAASLLLDQSIFDNGGRKAAREFASADVEVAAVSLSTAQNQRVFAGLTNYVNGERARAQADVSDKAAAKLAGFSEIMRKRVEGGISDLSEQSVIDQTIAEMQGHRRRGPPCRGGCDGGTGCFGRPTDDWPSRA